MPDAQPEWEQTVTRVIPRLLGAEVVAQRALAGGYTYSANRVARLSDGRSVYVKAAVDEQTRGWLRAEQRIYATVQAPFMPCYIGWEDGAATVLVLEDLSDATWPPPWSPQMVDAVRTALADLRGVTPPPGLPHPDDIDDLRGGWRTVAHDPGPLLSLGVCSTSWLDEALPNLLAAAERAPLDGDHLVHLDVRSDNLCIRDGRCLLVDWSYAAQGNPLLDLALWLPSLHLEGGPPPDELSVDGMGELAAVFAGYLACRAGLPEPPSVPPPGVRRLQVAQLRIALPWAARCLGVKEP
jgi:hypothetical protein